MNLIIISIYISCNWDINIFRTSLIYIDIKRGSIGWARNETNNTQEFYVVRSNRSTSTGKEGGDIIDGDLQRLQTLNCWLDSNSRF